MRRGPARLGAWLVALVAGCGDNTFPDAPALEPAAHLTILAHQDDDLLFMQPDVLDAVLTGDGVTNVYVTAGNGEQADLDLVVRRQAGLMAAYTAATGKASWSCGQLELAGHPVEHCQLAGAALSLVFLDYPDGGKQGEYPGSLLQLWEGAIERASTIGRVETTYDRDGLVAVLAAIIETSEPTTIRTLEIASTHGRDHSDHMLTGALAVLAVAATGSPADVISYRGYATDAEPANVIDALYDRSEELLAHYDACVTGCGPCGTRCADVSPMHATWMRRRYAVGRRTSAGGDLRAGAMCAHPTPDGEVLLGACDSPVAWALSTDGLLRVGDRCVKALPTGELVLGSDCLATPASWFMLDDEGHLWLGTPPFPQPDLELAHLQCIGVSGGRLRASVCGADRAPTWRFSRPAVETPRAALGLVASGRAVRLADLDHDGQADLCEVQSETLHCVRGLGSGSFDGVLELPLAVEPESLMIGDLDGDPHGDACGRDPAGIVCTDVSAGAMTKRWTSAFAGTSGTDATARSLAIIDRKICGVDEVGLLCAEQGPGGNTDVRSTWPRGHEVVWQGDLDGDHRGDWCITADNGVACGLASERLVTTDGVPWSFALAGVVLGAPADGVTSALGDIDGDGRADLCSLGDGRILCARSQGHGFGPPTVFADLPAGPDATALWLGDLDGDQRADACVDQGGAIICIQAP